jgi:DNA-binding HxlR family transcriptional regulator
MIDIIGPRTRRSYDCPIEFALNLIGGKWKSVIISKLKEKPLAYGELRRLVPNLSDKVLTERLRDLEADGLIARVKGPDQRMRYSLTARTAGLRPMLQGLYEWGLATAAEMQVEIRK